MHRVEDFEDSLYASAQIALRAAVGSINAEELLEKRVAIGTEVLEAIHSEAESFGLNVRSTDVKDVMLSGELKRAFTEVVRAKKEGEAALARARGESASLRNLANAAKLLEKNPSLLRLRYLETLDSAGKNASRTLVLGMPQDLLNDVT